jgi:hypothetical protein
VKVRTGEKLGRTLYVQLGPEPDHRPPAEGGDVLIGLVEPGWAEVMAACMNGIGWTWIERQLDEEAIAAVATARRIREAEHGR